MVIAVGTWEKQPPIPGETTRKNPVGTGSLSLVFPNSDNLANPWDSAALN